MARLRVVLGVRSGAVLARGRGRQSECGLAKRIVSSTVWLPWWPPASLSGRSQVWKATRSEAPQPSPYCPARRLRRRAGQ